MISLPSITSLIEFCNFMEDLPNFDKAAYEYAVDRNSPLTKPPGALGDLENLGIWYASWSGTAELKLEAPQVVIFAGNHGVTANFGISTFPAEVTEQMVFNFRAGGAAINQLAGV